MAYEEAAGPCRGHVREGSTLGMPLSDAVAATHKRPGAPLGSYGTSSSLEIVGMFGKLLPGVFGVCACV